MSVATSPFAVVVAGPTASGKTALALAIASSCDGEIVNYDSVQLYRDFDIGAAKPSPEELTRVPHHFIGEFDPRDEVSAGEYERRARPRIAEIAGRGRLVVLVGGTGFYLHALLHGLSPAPASPPEMRRRLRARLERHGPERLHRLLSRFDPAAARRIAPRDGARTVRALEVALLTGRPIEDAWRTPPPAPAARAIAKLGLRPDRAALYRRIDARAATMFAGPLQSETRALLDRYPHSLRLFQAHGYKQACDLLLRGADPAAALAEAQQEQRHYAKRQWTWFRRDPEFIWLDGFGDAPEVQRRAVQICREHLMQAGQ